MIVQLYLGKDLKLIFEQSEFVVTELFISI